MPRHSFVPRNFTPQLCASEDAAKKRLTANAAPPPTAPCGCCPPQPPVVDVETASSTLAAYDEGHRRTAAQPGSEGLGGALSANAWAAEQPAAPLQTSIRALLAAAAPADGRIMLGFCADDAAAGVAALKAWVTALGLPKGTLHGMDRDGVPLDMTTFGAVYIKYSSQSLSPGDPPGTAILSGYGGDFRGVYFNPQLPDGAFRQYAVLPLGLFELAADAAAPAAAAPPRRPSPRPAASRPPPSRRRSRRCSPPSTSSADRSSSRRLCLRWASCGWRTAGRRSCGRRSSLR